MAKKRTKKGLTPGIHKRIIEAAELGATIRDICSYAGISRSSYHKWLAQGEAAPHGAKRKLFDALRKARGRGRVEALRKIKNSDDWRAASFLLTHCGEGYTKTDRLELSGPDAGPIKTEVRAAVASLSMETKQKMLEELEAADEIKLIEAKVVEDE